MTPYVCPGLAIACGTCGAVSPGSCPALCPFAAIYCGVHGYTCRGKDDVNEGNDEAGEDEQEFKEVQ